MADRPVEEDIARRAAGGAGGRQDPDDGVRNDLKPDPVDDGDASRPSANGTGSLPPSDDVSYLSHVLFRLAAAPADVHWSPLMSPQNNSGVASVDADGGTAAVVDKTEEEQATDRAEGGDQAAASDAAAGGTQSAEASGDGASPDSGKQGKPGCKRSGSGKPRGKKGVSRRSPTAAEKRARESNRASGRSPRRRADGKSGGAGRTASSRVSDSSGPEGAAQASAPGVEAGAGAEAAGRREPSWRRTSYDVVVEGAESIQHALGLRDGKEPVDDELEKDLLAELEYGGVDVFGYEEALRGGLRAHHRGVNAATMYLSFRDCLGLVEQKARLAVGRAAYQAGLAQRTSKELVEAQLYISQLLPALNRRVREFDNVLDQAYKRASEHVAKRFESVRGDVDLIRNHAVETEQLLQARIRRFDTDFDERLKSELGFVTTRAGEIVKGLDEAYSAYLEHLSRVNKQLAGLLPVFDTLRNKSDSIQTRLNSATSQVSWRLFFVAGVAGFVGAGLGAILALLVWIAVVS